MAHTIHHKAELLHRVRRLRGQVQALERALEEERSCTSILQLITACRGAIGSLMYEVVEGHVMEHVVAHASRKNSRHVKAAEELLGVFKTYIR